MSKTNHVVPWFLLLAAGGLLPALPHSTFGQPSPAAAAAAPEIRAFWVDAFNPGIRTPQEAARLVADAQRAGINTLIVQVRRRGDALYRKGFEPPLDDPAYDPQFDALEHIVEKAHAAGLQVHAWINAMPVWRDEKPPRDARHVFNQHGPSATGADRWLTESPQGEMKFLVGYFLDPGHPAAAAYLTEIYLNIVRNYAVDGIHFDYVRYPETAERLPRGAPVGYNAINLERFRRAHGLLPSAIPDPSDERWMEWRRQQVTNLVRRIYIETKAINPRMQVSAALIPWGKPPTNEKDFGDVAPMQRIFQDWHGWLREGILDLAIPMNYLREHDPVQRGWFDGWIRWEKRHKHGRHLAVGIGAYVNTQANTLAQIARVRQGEGGRRADGVSFFSYANLFPAARPAPATAPADNAVRAGAAFPAAAPANAPAAPVEPEKRVVFLSTGAEGATAAFAQPALPPRMDWIEAPRTGWVAGQLKPEMAENPAIRVAIRKRGLFSRTRRAEPDGNGWFGFTAVAPGRYRIWVESGKARVRGADIEVAAGKVARPAEPLP
jgi:uncharacterized lipoprotein YddW (UPF0748 family)